MTIELERKGILDSTLLKSDGIYRDLFHIKTEGETEQQQALSFAGEFAQQAGDNKIWATPYPTYGLVSVYVEQGTSEEFKAEFEQQF